MGLLETLSSLIPDFSLGDVIIGGEKDVEERKTIIVDYGDGDAVERTEDANIVDVGEFDSENREAHKKLLFRNGSPLRNCSESRLPKTNRRLKPASEMKKLRTLSIIFGH